MATNKQKQYLAAVIADEKAVLESIKTTYAESFKAAVNFVQTITDATLAYRELCETLRTQDVPKKERNKLLIAAGINPVRASEIGRVVDSPPSLFKKYISGGIGFKAALAIARDTSSGKGKQDENPHEAAESEFTAALRHLLTNTDLPARPHLDKFTLGVSILKDGVEYTIFAKAPAVKSTK